MPGEDEITLWIRQLSDGDEEAARVIWDEYFNKLVNLARRKLQDMPRRTFDEEDVAISAMHSFCRGVEAGRFEKLDDRVDLWKLLVTITARKVHAQRRRSLRSKRGSGQVRGESVFVRNQGDDRHGAGISDVLGEEPTPELAATLVENTGHLLDCLEDESLSKIAVMKLEGYTNDEIAEEIQCVRRTVERKLERIREKWAKEGLGGGE